ncbi:MAG: hypothetical protein AAFZ99_06655 [Pseudomonadota bacterium]
MQQQSNASASKIANTYEFGTFADRLSHACATLEVEPPHVDYEDGEPLLTDDLVAWIKSHGVNMDWLFCGIPTALLKTWSHAHKEERQILEYLGTLDETEKEIFGACIKMMATREVDAEQFIKLVFAQIDAHRAAKAA